MSGRRRVARCRIANFNRHRSRTASTIGVTHFVLKRFFAGESVVWQERISAIGEHCHDAVRCEQGARHRRGHWRGTNHRDRCRRAFWVDVVGQNVTLNGRVNFCKVDIGFRQDSVHSDRRSRWSTDVSAGVRQRELKRSVATNRRRRSIFIRDALDQAVKVRFW